MNRSKGAIFSLALALIAGAGGFLLWLKAHQQLGPPGLRLELPERVLGYQSESFPITKEESSALPKDTSFSRRMYSEVQDGLTNQLQLGIVLMGTDRTSIHKPQFCLVGQGWAIDRTEELQIPLQRPHPYDLPVMKLTASKQAAFPGGRIMTVRSLYVYWFVADQRLTANHWQRMWWMTKNLMQTGVLQRWAYVSCFAVCYPGQEDATYERMRQFLASAVPEFQLTTGPVRPSVPSTVAAVVRGLQPASVQSLPEAMGLSFAQASNER